MWILEVWVLMAYVLICRIPNYRAEFTPTSLKKDSSTTLAHFHPENRQDLSTLPHTSANSNRHDTSPLAHTSANHKGYKSTVPGLAPSFTELPSVTDINTALQVSRVGTTTKLAVDRTRTSNTVLVHSSHRRVTETSTHISTIALGTSTQTADTIKQPVFTSISTTVTISPTNRIVNAPTSTALPSAGHITRAMPSPSKTYVPSAFVIYTSPTVILQSSGTTVCLNSSLVTSDEFKQTVAPVHNTSIEPSQSHSSGKLHFLPTIRMSSTTYKTHVSSSSYSILTTRLHITSSTNSHISKPATTDITSTLVDVSATESSTSSYDKELVIIFGSAAGIMVAVLLACVVMKKRKQIKSDRFIVGGGDIRIELSRF